jgi:hypothetical protein
MSLLPESDADWGRQIRLALTNEAARPLEEIKRQSASPSRTFSDFEAAMSEWSFAYGIAWAIARLRDPFSPPNRIADAALRLALEAWPSGPEEVWSALKELGEAEQVERPETQADPGPRLDEFARNLGDIRAERPRQPPS